MSNIIQETRDKLRNDYLESVARDMARQGKKTRKVFVIHSEEDDSFLKIEAVFKSENKAVKYLREMNDYTSGHRYVGTEMEVQ